jgi:hypothetical protein
MSAYRDTIMRLIRQRMGDEPTQAWMRLQGHSDDAQRDQERRDQHRR